MQQRAEMQHIMDEYTDLLFRIAYYYTKNASTAEDIVQDVFIKFYYQVNNEVPNHLRAYLAKMTANKSKDYLKSWAYQKQKLTKNLPFLSIQSESEELYE